MLALSGPILTRGRAHPNSRFDNPPGELIADDRRPIATLASTGERLVPGTMGGKLFRQHEVRYVFAGALVQGKQVLDVASGSGIGTHYLLCAGARSCLGFDIDREAIEYARAAYSDCRFTQCEATRLCLADASVDVVVSFETIEHIKDQKAFLLECRRVLRPGGVFVCSTPNRTLARWGEDNPFHLRELTVAQFNDLVAAVFTDVCLFSQNDSVYPLYVGKTILSRILNRLKLMDSIKRFLSQPTTSPQATEFSGNSDNVSEEIKRFKSQLLCQPMFVIAVARKALG
jgi:ubiquinone/menaquinone biosynthesis C-methylase UbiE